MGGKPSKGTPKDMRLAVNKAAAAKPSKPAAPKPFGGKKAPPFGSKPKGK